MRRKEEDYILDTLEDIQDTIRSPAFKQLLRETHENNIMLKQIIKVINTYVANHHNENEDDFSRNVLANLISNQLDIFKIK